MKKILILAFCALFFTACSNLNFKNANNNVVKDYEISSEAIFSVVGEGLAPIDTVSPAQARALAKRAAVADAQRQLAAKLYGTKINSKDTVKDAVLKSSVIDSRISGLVKGATITSQEYRDGLYTVEMELKMNSNKWQELFAY